MAELEVDRGDYDPVNKPEHRIPPETTSGVLLPTMPPGVAGGMDPLMVLANVPKPPPVEPEVTGRMEDRPHFIRNVEGVETCGQCGKPFPCPDYLSTVEVVAETASPDWPTAVADVERVAAEAAGITVEELRARIRQAQGRRYP